MRCKSYTLRKIREASERGRKMARIRWAADKKRRAAWAADAAIDPLRVVGRILERVVVIRNESEVVEIVRWDWTSAREWARKKRAAGL